MAKKKRRNKKTNIILNILIIILLITIICNILITIKIQNRKNERDNILTDINNTIVNIEKTNNEIDNVKNNISILENIDNEISLVKKEYFNNIKTLEDKILSGKSNEKIVYLTFDDGPYYSTHQILDILTKYDVLATFFTIGLNKDICFDNKSEDCSGLYKREYDLDHTLANHTYSHGIFKGLYNSADSFMEQVKIQEDLIYKRTGHKTNIVRFPGGSATAGKLKNEIIERLRANGYGWIDWTASTGDGGRLYSSDQAWNNFINSINSNIEVLLMHDYSKYTIEILPREIEYLQNNGYHIYPLFYESNMVHK